MYLQKNHEIVLVASKNFLIDYSTGFGGKYGVQKDRVDQVDALSSFFQICVNNNVILSSIIMCLF